MAGFIYLSDIFAALSYLTHDVLYGLKIDAASGISRLKRPVEHCSQERLLFAVQRDTFSL
jgi:hypothetical protein